MEGNDDVTQGIKIKVGVQVPEIAPDRINNFSTQ
jgi:hypothetical protein